METMFSDLPASYYTLNEHCALPTTDPGVRATLVDYCLPYAIETAGDDYAQRLRWQYEWRRLRATPLQGRYIPDPPREYDENELPPFRGASRNEDHNRD